MRMENGHLNCKGKRELVERKGAGVKIKGALVRCEKGHERHSFDGRS